MIIGITLIALAVSAVPATAQMGVWRDINPDAYISPPANPQLNSIYMLSPTSGWAVGDSRPTTNDTTALPAIFHYDGSTWNLVPAPKIADFPSKQAAYNLTSVTFGPPGNPITPLGTDGWAVGYNNTPASGVAVSLALHWDGITWRSQLAGLSGPNAGPLWSAFMVSSTDIWAVGQNQAGGMGVFWHWTGVPGLGGGWNMPQAPVPCPVSIAAPKCGIYSVFMVSSTEGWAVGAGGIIFHYFGGVWNTFTSPVDSCPSPAPACTYLRSVYMISPTEGWAVGDGGVIIHFSTGIWSGPVSPGTTSNNLFSVFMVSSTEGWAFGAKGSILHYSGGAWTLLPSNLVPTSPVSLLNFASGFFNSANDGWVVGTDGVIVHFDGVNYGTVTSPTINNFTSISFGEPCLVLRTCDPSIMGGLINPNDGWAVGNSSVTDGVTPFEPTIFHWNGFAWTKGVAIGTTNNLNSVFMVNSGDVWAVGGGPHPTASCSVSPCPIILHFTGGSWNTITPPPGQYSLKSIFMVSSNEGWAVGEQVASPYPTGIILHYTVTGGVGTWAVFPAPSSPAAVHGLNSVFMVSQNEGWAVGDNATILHYTVSGGVGTWNLVTVSGSPTLSLDANLTSVFLLTPTSGWAVGGIQQTGSFSAGPVIIYWDGTKWEPVATPTIPGGMTSVGHTSATLKSVFLDAPNDGWAVGFPGKLVATILHWDGVSWRHVTLSPALLGEIPPILSSVYMTSETNGWVVGGSPDFVSASYFTEAALYGYKTPLSTMLRFSPFGGIFSTTSTSIVVSTVSTSTTALTTTFSSTTSIVCPSNVTVSIKVVDSQGNPLSGVNVVVTPAAFTTCLPGPLQGVTNSQGLVTFTLPPGTYTVALSKNGVTSTQSITVTTSGGQVFTLTLNVTQGGLIPGFPVESILAGIIVGIGTLVLLRRRRAR
ncbi:MAG: carboxypeptidase-like regulatory domain-containing protein [Candidatus Bathyarchaeia archaeon]